MSFRIIVCRVLAAAALSLLVSATAQAQIYKWVDANGVTHFSDKAVDGAKVAAPAPSSSGNKGAAADSWQDKALEFKRRQIQRQEAEAKAAADAKSESDSRRERCIAAHGRLEILERASGIYDMNEKGERVYIDDQERAKRTQKTQQSIHDNCL